MLKREVYVKNIYTDGEIHTAARNIQLFLLMLTDKSELQACMRNCKVVWLVVKCSSAIPYLLFLSVRGITDLNKFIHKGQFSFSEVVRADGIGGEAWKKLVSKDSGGTMAI